jgi:uncharacterized protein
MTAFGKAWVVEARYADGAQELRAPWRAEHLARTMQLRDSGRLLFGGAFEDLSASLVGYIVESEAAARELVESDVYWRKGVWTDYTVRALAFPIFD